MTTTPPPPGAPTDPPADPPAGGATATDPSDQPHEHSHAHSRDGGHHGPRVTAEEVRDLGRLRRTVHDRKVAGVAGGLARHLDVDPIIVRVAFVVLAFFGGAGLILYAAGWALLPEDGEERASVHLDERSRTVALVAVLVLAGLALVGDSWGAGWFWFPWPLAVIGLIAFVWLRGSRDRDARRAAAAADPAGPAVTDGSEAVPPTYAAGYTPYAPPPRDPRKRGPRLFWFTLLLIAVAEGALGIADGAGAAVTDSAYAALAVALVALMLLVGSVVGRAGGLIALGLVASVALAGATVADRWDGERFTYHPRSAAEVQDGYTMRNGTLVVDLTDLDDPTELDGRTIDVRGEVGALVVRIPEESTVRIEADIDGPGGYDFFQGDRQGGGIDTTTTATWRGAADPTFTIDAALEVGVITVETE